MLWRKSVRIGPRKNFILERVDDLLAEKLTQKSRRLDAGPEIARSKLSGLLDHFAEGDQSYLRGTSVPMLIWFAEVSRCRCLQDSSLRDMT